MENDIRLVIFDFDGTLADTAATILSTYRAAIAALGLPERTDSACRATIGLPLREGFRALFPDAAEELLGRCVDTYRDIFQANKARLRPRLYPGVKETLEALRGAGMEMSIASSRNRESLCEFCRENGIGGYFSLVLGADDVVHAKPDPEPVEITLSRLGYRPSEAVVVGDMPVDIAMGRGAGCPTVGVSYGNSTASALACAGATAVIDRISLLPATISRGGTLFADGANANQ